MRGTLRAFLFLSLLAAGTRSFAIGYVVGNGGDGYLQKSHIYLRDLVEAGVAEHPYFMDRLARSIPEDHMATKFQARLNSWNISKNLSVSKKLLARKLADLEALSPFLGTYVLEALLSYSWVSVTEPLGPTPDREGVFGEDTTLVQIANRLDTIIRIHLPSWKKMNAENRVALLIHEAIYSLLKPICTSEEGSCYQLSRSARQIVGQLFSKSSFMPGNTVITRQILPLLDVPWKELSRPHRTHKDSMIEDWSVAFFPGVGSPFQPLSLSTNLPLQDNSFIELLSLSCNRWAYYQSRYPDRPFFVRSEIKIPPYQTKFVSYSTTAFTKDFKRKQTFQKRLMIFLRKPYADKDVLKINLSQTTAEKCAQQLFRHLKKAMEK